ncbi:MAG: flagellar assembly protein FliH [Rhodoferax sp.]|nr:flagellar assembly protein FliH [Rhodoferax sp.]
MRNYSRFIPVEEIEAVRQWDFGDVDTRALLLAAQARAQEDEADRGRLDAARNQGFADGFAQGLAQARLEAEQQFQHYVAEHGQSVGRRFGQLFEAAGQQIEQAEERLAQGILDVACELARQVIRRELTVNPNGVLPVAREALGMLMADARSAVVRLNPQDHAVLEETVRTEFPALALTLVADPAVTPGGCVVESAGTVVDGTLERRWLRTLASLGREGSWEPDGAV